MKSLFFSIALTVLSFSAIFAQGIQSYNNAEILAIEAQISALEDIHCEVPCGIYGDSLRIKLIKEHIKTIEKAMMKIQEYSNASQPDYNQLIRWVMNKESHAEKIQHIVSQYFMHQRIKLTDPKDKAKHDKYVAQLTHLHEISVYSMKSKQSTDLANIGKLTDAVHAFEKVYFHKH